MVGVDDGEDGMVHVSMLRASGDVDEIEFHRLSIRRCLGNHARPIAGIAIMRQVQAITIQVEHGERMIEASRIVRRSCFLHLMRERVSPGSHSQRDLHGFAHVPVGLRRGGCYGSLPRTGQGFQFVKGLLRVGLGKSRGREQRQNNNGQH